MADPKAEIYDGRFRGTYTLFPDNAIAIDISTADHVLPAFATVYVGATGNVVVAPAGGGSNVTFVGIPAGGVVPVRVKTVVKTLTTATSMVAVY